MNNSVPIITSYHLLDKTMFAICIKSSNIKWGLVSHMCSSPSLYFPVLTRPPIRPASWAPAQICNSFGLICQNFFLNDGCTYDIISYVISNHKYFFQWYIFWKPRCSFRSKNVTFNILLLIFHSIIALFAAIIMMLEC